MSITDRAILLSHPKYCHVSKSRPFLRIHLSILRGSWTSCADFNPRDRKDIVTYKWNNGDLFGVFVDSRDSLFQNREELNGRCEDS